MAKISVIIPLSKDEKNHLELLKSIPDDMEIILSSKDSRANSLNDGALKSSGEYLWFLHADSVINNNVIEKLYNGIKNYPNNLLFFDLGFTTNSISLMMLNAFGTKIRSHFFKTPFGDQGFCISRELFDLIGGFPENLEYGEDHVFVWRARQNNINLKSAGATIYTSDRKYKKNGWLKTTLSHQYLWIIQAFKQWKKLMKGSEI